MIYDTFIVKVTLAFIKQLVFALAAILFYKGYYPKNLKQVFWMANKPMIGMWIFIWFVLGTWYRYVTQMPILGIWGYLFNMKY